MDIKRCFDDDDEYMTIEPPPAMSEIITVMPEIDWLVDDCHVPILYYNTSPEFPHYIAPDLLLVGASWTFAINQPHWLFRQSIFEKNYFPYKRDFYYITIQNGFIAIDDLNLCYVTDKRDTRIVYMKLFDKFRQRMVFHENGIYLTEFISS